VSERNFATRTAPQAADALPGWVLLALPAVALLAVLLATRSAASSRASVEQALGEVQRATGEERAQIARLKQAAAREPTIPEHALPGRILARLQPSLPSDVRLVSLQVRYASPAVDLVIGVEARDTAAYDQFIAQLAANPSFTRVLPGDESRSGAPRTTVRVSWQGTS
jgi:hypothetical protein